MLFHSIKIYDQRVTFSVMTSYPTPTTIQKEEITALYEWVYDQTLAAKGWSLNEMEPADIARVRALCIAAVIEFWSADMFRAALKPFDLFNTAPVVSPETILKSVTYDRKMAPDLKKMRQGRGKEWYKDFFNVSFIYF